MEDSTVVEPQCSNYNDNSDNVQCYDDLFPALPEMGTPKYASNAPQSSNNSMRVGRSIVTQVFYVPSGERKYDSEKFGEGESLRTCQHIMKDTGAHIEISSGKDQSLTFLVTGKQTEVIEARRKILVHFQAQASKTINIPRDHHRWILGKRCERLRELEKMTATKITVPRINDESDAITITGTREGIEKAEHEIRTMSDEQSRKAVEHVVIPKMYHPFILGPHSETVNRISEETGARINVPPPSVQKDEIIITGEKEGVLEAKSRIEVIYKQMEKKCTSVGVEVPRAQHKYIIGVRGSTIQEILQLTGVSVEMPPSDSTTDTITLRGPQDKLGNALSTVYGKANSIRTATVDCPHWIHKYIIGRDGANIKELTAAYTNIHVEFNDDKIKLEGLPEQVEAATEVLEKTVKDYLEQLSFVEMTVDPIYYKHIIGKAGANINRYRDEYKVMLNIQEKDGINRIRIEGPVDCIAKAQAEILEKIAKLENEKEEKITIDHRHFKTIIGKNGENIREIRDKHNQVQIIFPTPNDKSDIVRIRGPPEDVERCHSYLKHLVIDLQKNSFVMEVPIFKQFHKYIIGKGGANIKKIRDETQTKIELPAEGDTNDVIVITGKKENVKEARDRIQKIQDELADIVTEEIQIPPKYYNSLIGAGGKLITSIMEECGGVLIKFPSPDSKTDKVTIRGPSEDVARAKKQLIELTNEKELSSFSVEVRAKPQHHKFLIGKNGASIKKIRDSTGARIVFPGVNDADKEAITIIGKKECIEEAKAQLLAIIKNIDNIVEDEISVEQKHHRHFVARRGDVLHRITEECGGVMISFPRPGIDSDRVTLKGAKDCIEAAKQRILEIVADLNAVVTIECVIPQKHHRIVMGKGGVKVQGITSEFDVQIKFPDRDTQDYGNSNKENGDINGDDSPASSIVNSNSNDIIRISGRLEKCEAAKQALLNLVPITEDIHVPFDLHRSIIGQKGRYVKELMNRYDVHIELSPQDQKLDLIKVTGAPAHIAEAKVAIEERVKELEADRKDRELRSFELKLEINPDYHPKLIGRRGVVINKIRAKHGVQISFPKSDDPANNIITIQGYEQAAEAARDEMMQIVDDLSSLTKETVPIDARVHPHLIGSRGRRVREIMQQYKVEINFPRPDDPDLNLVTITGAKDNIDACRDHLLNLEEEYLQDVVDTLPSQQHTFTQIFEETLSHAKTNKQGFVVQGAPWERKAPNTNSQEDFPDFGGVTASTAPNDNQQPISSAWNSRH
uniref:Putative vigilin n=1 Tax=Corethrella appendiculata TaxID=1370023 RepID=U5EUN4_9DIPT